jgi:hypothetical protein
MITLCSQQAESQNHENANVLNIGQSDDKRKRNKRLKLGKGQVYGRPGD